LNVPLKLWKNVCKKKSCVKFLTLFLGFEPYFAPSSFGLQHDSLPFALRRVLDSCEELAVHEALIGNVVISGGCAKFPGLANRVIEEIKNDFRNSQHFLRDKIHVEIVKEPLLGTYRGAVAAVGAGVSGASSENQGKRGVRAAFPEGTFGMNIFGFFP
jgi:hypothetical protein